MKRNDITTADKLAIGDVFYKLGDKAKIKFEIVNEKPKQTHFQTYTIFARKASALHANALKRTTQVVFLRNVNETVTA